MRAFVIFDLPHRWEDAAAITKPGNEASALHSGISRRYSIVCGLNRQQDYAARVTAAKARPAAER